MLRHYEPLAIDYERDGRYKDAIKGFTKEYRFLSNFYVCSRPIIVHNIPFDCSERAYVWHKNDTPAFRRKLMQAKTPNECKKIGAATKLRPDWDEVKIRIMYDILKIKFEDERLQTRLQATEDRYLEETNWWNDTFWGRCNGVGKNHLGRILMCIRYTSRL